MATTVKCKLCGEQVEIPTGTAFDAVVRCPLCKSESPLYLLLSGVPAASPSTGPQAPTAGAELPAAAAPSEPAAATVSAEAATSQPAAAGPVGETATAAEEVPAELVATAEPAGPSGTAETSAVVPASLAGPAAPAAVEPVAQAPAGEAAPPSSVFDVPHIPEDPAPQASADGASVAGALMDLWKDAGVAPPLDIPEGATAEKPTAEEDHAPMPDAYEFSGAKSEGGLPPAAPRHSYSERVREAEKITPKKTVRVVGMIVAGVLGVLVAWGLFSLFASPRTPPERPAGASSNSSTPSKGKTSAGKSKPNPKTDFSFDDLGPPPGKK